MNKCEHGDRIGTFCLYENCTQKEISGCFKCMQQYHKHGPNIDMMTEDDVNKALQKLVFEKQTKPFSQSLIHKIYTLLTFYKNCISHAIDNLSTNTVNKLGHTFMFGKPQFQTYNKLRKRQYRKINRHQLKNFLNFTKTLNPEWAEQIQQSRYQEFCDQVMNTIEQLNKSFYSLSSILPFKSSDISIYQSNYSQLKQINTARKKSIEDKNKCINPLKKLNLQRGQRISKPPQLNELSPQNSVLNSNLTKISSRRFTDRSRVLDSSIDAKIPIRMQKSCSVQKKIKQNNDFRLQKFNETADSFDFKNNLRHIVKQNVKFLQPQNFNMRFSEPLQKNKQTIVKKISESNQININNEQIRQEQQDSTKFHKKRSKYWKLSEEIDKQSFPIDLIIGTIIKHTVLPDPVEKTTTPYQNSQILEKKTITIPIGINETEIQEVSSPIFKKIKDKKQKGGLFLINKILENDESKNKEDASDYHFSQNETLSLAILLKALTQPSTSQAIKMLKQSYKLAPNNISAAEYLSYLYILDNRPKQCLDICNQVLQKIANSPNYDQNCNIRSNKAAALNLLGRFSESIKVIEKCLSEKKKDVLYKNAGDAYYGIGIYQKAINNYQQALKLNNNNHETYFNLAVCFYIQGSYNCCKTHLNKALQLSHDNQEYKQLRIQLSKFL